MAFYSATAVAILLLLLLLLGIALADNNVMFSGSTLDNNEQLTYGNHQFVMQPDCILALYGGASNFRTNTYNKGKDCKLSFNEYGRLFVITGEGRTVWASPNVGYKKSNYVAVLRPDGEVAVYGPQVWSTIPKPSGVSSERSVLSDYERKQKLSNEPNVKNILFSGELLFDGGALATRDYTLTMGSDCNAVLKKATYYGETWQSRTAGNGQGCFLRLNHYGQLAVVDDVYRPVWNSTMPPEPDYGEYVFVVQYNNRAVVYGPKIWTTATATATVTDKVSDGRAKM